MSYSTPRVIPFPKWRTSQSARTHTRTYIHKQRRCLHNRPYRFSDRGDKTERRLDAHLQQLAHHIHTFHHTFHPGGLSINNGWKDDTRVGVRVTTSPGPVFLQTPRQYYNSASCSVILSTPLVESMTLYCPPLAGEGVTTSSDGRRR